jgi:putative protease
LNTRIVDDFPGRFSRFFIDLREIKTETKIGTDKGGIVQLFENFLNGVPGSKAELTQAVCPTSDDPYKQGL